MGGGEGGGGRWVGVRGGGMLVFKKNTKTSWDCFSEYQNLHVKLPEVETNLNECG